MLTCSHSFSSLKISGPHSEVSLMTHKHISMTFMWNRVCVCVCVQERQTQLLMELTLTFSEDALLDQLQR